MSTSKLDLNGLGINGIPTNFYDLTGGLVAHPYLLCI